MPNYTDTQLRMANAHAGQLLHAVNRIVKQDASMTEELLIMALTCGIGNWLGRACQDHDIADHEPVLAAYQGLIRHGAEAGLQAVTAEEAA